MEHVLRQRLGANLRRHRAALELSQEKFAEMLDLHRTYVGALERGERNPTLRTVENLASQLGIDDPLDLLQP